MLARMTERSKRRKVSTRLESFVRATKVTRRDGEKLCFCEGGNGGQGVFEKEQLRREERARRTNRHPSEGCHPVWGQVLQLRETCCITGQEKGAR